MICCVRCRVLLCWNLLGCSRAMRPAPWWIPEGREFCFRRFCSGWFPRGGSSLQRFCTKECGRAVSGLEEWDGAPC
ncbi:hypothetical protein M758_3G161500 [Ceratodon purpureus]|nr:hypothetical protein M758_3G161500 [Ceratodon purpureus]